MSTKLKPKDAATIALASGASQRAAARQAGCSPRTISRWLLNAEFRQGVASQRAELLDRAAGRLSGMLQAATSTLKNLLTSENETIQLAAVKLVLESTVNLRTITEFEKRLSELESAR